MDENDCQNSIEFKFQLDNLLNSSSLKKVLDLELTDIYDSKIQDNLETLLHNNDSQFFLEKDSSIKKQNFKTLEKSDINMLSLDLDGFTNGLNNLDIDSLEQILKSSYPIKKFNLNKSLEENSIQNSIALNHALLLLKSYDGFKENEDGAVNETYLNEIERILDGIHSPEKKSPQKLKREKEILIELNGNLLLTEKEEIMEFELGKEEEKVENIGSGNFLEEFDEKARKTKNCYIF